MDAQILKDFTDLLTAVRKAMDEYLLTGELRGVACAAGTLTAHINVLKAIVTAQNDRYPDEKDRNAILRLASTLDWLSKDDYAGRDFAGSKLRLPETAFNNAFPDIAVPGEIDYRPAMVMLRSAVLEIVLEGQSA